MIQFAQITQETCDLNQKLGLKNRNLGFFVSCFQEKASCLQYLGHIITLFSSGLIG